MAEEDSRVRARRWRAPATSAVILLFAICSFIAYAVVSVTINGEPSVSAFHGWVAVLQPVDELSDHQVRLVVAAGAPGAPGEHPRLTYTVAACGDRPFNGALILGGDARLTDFQTVGSIREIVATSPGSSLQSSIEDVTDLTFLDVQSNEQIDLGPAQVIHLQSGITPRCLYPYSALQLPPAFVGDAEIVTGLAMASVQRNSGFWWWTGPRSSQVWPLVGSLPDVSFSDLGIFAGVRGLHGDWIRPTQEYVRVDIGGLTARAVVDQVRPEPSDATDLVWDGSRPLQPTVLLTNVEVMGRWQDVLIGAAIGLGIGAALLAGLALEIFRPPMRPSPVAVGELTADSSKPQTMETIQFDWLIVVMVLGLWLLLRRITRRRPQILDDRDRSS
jgi:hypothetical protein